MPHPELQPLAGRTAPRTPRSLWAGRTARAGACALCLGVFGVSSEAPAQELRAPAAESARSLLGRSLDNLQRVSLATRVEARTQRADGSTEQRSFIVLRHTSNAGLHTLLAGFEAGSNLSGVRILQIDTPEPAETRAFIHSPEIGIIPQPTPYRLVDPFLGRAILQGNSLASTTVRGIDFEILGRTPAVIRGEPVERIRVRPFRPADYDVADLFVSPSDAAILESRYYVNGEIDALRVVQTPRERMRRIGDRILPEMMIYTENGKQTSLELRHAELRDPPQGLFEPTRFHLQPIDALAPARFEVR